MTDPSAHAHHPEGHGGAHDHPSEAHAPRVEDRSAPETEADWDLKYSGEQVWSGRPNASLVAEAPTLPVGRALDVGAGEGGDAVYLAEHGWTVTASDISRRALERVAEAAAARGVSVRALHADANAPDPFGAEQYDLVTVHYASIPRRSDHRAVSNLLRAVAPGGSLLVVSHDFAEMRAAIAEGHMGAHDPDAYERVEDVADALDRSPQWVIDVYESRPRPAGAASHHIADVILRAHRVA
jgi:SAM-dependent methyltransferase